LHAPHCASQADAQQTPSAQTPFAQWSVELQVEPKARFTMHLP
jgi:hypothetical protein